MRWLALMAAAAIAAAARADTGDAASIAECDMPAFARVLVPARQPAAAADAVWLDDHRLQWPGHPARGRYRLYASATARLLAQPGKAVQGADDALDLSPVHEPIPATLARRFRYLPAGVVLTLPDAQRARLKSMLRGELLLVHEDDRGRVLDAARTQTAQALDALYAAAAERSELGVGPGADRTAFALWAPTARRVAVCLYAHGDSAAERKAPLRVDHDTGIWRTSLPADLRGRYYTYVVDVTVPGVGLVRNRVTDPYSISLSTDSRRSYIGRLDDPALRPAGWASTPSPPAVRTSDMVVYELHVRDFSANDASVPPAHRGKYLAFTDGDSNGMRHLRALAQAGLTDVHLLPVFDFGSVPESACVTPHPEGGAASSAQRGAVAAVKGRDCFNWGYDPVHYGAPEGSYASDAADGARRIVEFRAMVQALHRAGLRVGMDVVYNHTFAAGQQPLSVLDRIVPGYYQRLDAQGRLETSTCCANTATEHRMMGKLLVDTVLRWATAYQIDSFRFDLMAHQPRALMEALQARLRAATGREVPLIGEGWNFGEVADGARFVQASQLSLNGSGIGTFNDRLRDALRGGSAGDSGRALIAQQGWINGLGYDRNALSTQRRDELLHAADLVRAGLAGSLADYPLRTTDGRVVPLREIDYHGQPAGYASQPAEVVNYVENHDNLTLFDNDVLKLPRATSGEDRARVQILGAAVVAFSQGVAYFHAGLDTLRSKSLDRNSFDSGDWFNRLDWTYRDNNFGVGLPPAQANGADDALLAPLLADPSLKPAPAQIAWTRDAFRDLLRIRASTPLLHLDSAAEVKARLSFADTGPDQEPTVIVGVLDGRGLPGAVFDRLVYLVNVDKTAHEIRMPALRGEALQLHPVLAAPGAADTRAREARYDAASGTFNVPPRAAVVFVRQARERAKKP
jgi:pullulanase/glycogen debranching enzyme